MQTEDGDIILTDLESTNGTRVNGSAVQIRRLRPGDQVSIGRTLLLFGTMEEIEARRQGHKKQLLDSWREAVNRKDVDGSIEILKKLDIYLTPVEAESMQERSDV